jgi:MSHA biogenesis protein MshI
MRWPWQKKSSNYTYCLGIELNHGKAFAVLRDGSGVVDSYASEQDDDGFQGLSQWLAAKRYGCIPVTVCLDQSRYQLQLVDSPPVADDELSDALSFRIRDLISESAENKLLQAFPLPGDAYRGRMSMAFAAITDRDYLRDIVRWCRKENLELQTITIDELSLLNLVAALEPETSVGVLRLEPKEGMIYLYQDGALYFTRHLNIGTDDLMPEDASVGDFTLENGSRSDMLTLEVQRSMDYFESQLGLGTIGQLWVLPPDSANIDNVLIELEASVQTPVRLLSLETAFNRQSSESPLTASFAAALGGTLSYELAN